MNEMERNLRAAKYSARVAIERQRAEQKMDRAVLKLLKKLTPDHELAA